MAAPPGSRLSRQRFSALALNVSSPRCRDLSGVGGRPDSSRTSQKRRSCPEAEARPLWRTTLEIRGVIGIASTLVLGYLRIGAQQMTGYYCPGGGLIVRELRGD